MASDHIILKRPLTPTLSRAAFRAVRGKCKDRLFEDLLPKRGSADAPFTLFPRWPGGEGRVRGADEPVCGAAHLPSQPCGWAPPAPP